MMKTLRLAALALLTAAATANATTPAATTLTNVLQNISLQLTVYQQGATSSDGKKVADKVYTYNTKNLIQALGSVTGNNFGNSAKLVLSTVYSNVTVATGSGTFSNSFSTNLAIATNGYLNVGGAAQLYGIFGNPGIVTISNGAFLTGAVGTVSSNVISTVNSPTNVSVNFSDTAGFITTLTPATNNSGFVTNVAVVTQSQLTPPPTTTLLTNVSSSIDILYSTVNALYPVTNYLSFGTNSPEIVVETGTGLTTANPSLTSQNGISLQSLNINYDIPTGSTNLTLNLTGFVKQALKVDVLVARGTNRVVEDIFGATATWNAIGSGYTGGAFTTNTTSVPILVSGVLGYLTNASPIVVEGTVNISFLKNLAQ